METEFNDDDDSDILYLTVDIVSSYISKNTMPSEELPQLITSVYDSIKFIKTEPENSAKEPAVSIKKSISQDYLVCLEDGKKLTMLKRYLKTNYNMTPEEYRLKWNLPANYPMVAPAYASKRSLLAKKSGLGKLTGRKR